MMYTKADAEKAVKEVFGKTLFFEGAGCAERGDVENCRIRTAFRNNKGESFYLELSGIEVTQKSPERFKKYCNAGFIDYCYQLGNDGEKIRFDIEKLEYEYSKEGILDFVNGELGCSFEQIIILDMFDDYRVHKLNGGVNFMEDFAYNPTKAAAARKAFNKIDMEIRHKMGEKYSQISLVKVGVDYIKVRCYASDKKMKEAGLDPDNRYIIVSIGGRENA